MGIGTRIRHGLGRWEIPVSKFYRGLFVDLRALANLVASIAPPKRVLEVGCGDGAFGEELVRAIPDADYLGIDIAQTAGRLYRGDPQRATFRVVTVQDLLAERPDPFDLVVFVDVVHHIPSPQRPGVLNCASVLTAPEGHLMVKEWERDTTLGYHIVHAADRFVTGDRGVSFLTLSELHGLVDSVECFEARQDWRIPPMHNNVLCSRRRFPAADPSGTMR